MSSYIGLIRREAGTDYGVSFPDFPGLATAGASLAEAQAMAEEALAFHIEGLAKDGLPVPEPSELDQIVRDPGNRDGVAIRVAVGSFNTSACF